MFSANSSQVSEDRLYVEDVFSTYLYTGNGSTQTITNGIDLAGKGGMVWIKDRSAASSQRLYDTTRGANNAVFSNLTNAQTTVADSLTSFNSNGFTAGSANGTNGNNYASWTFRKAPKFFDVVTYTGNGVSTGRNISHALGVRPGFIVVKRTDSTSDWAVLASNGTTGYYGGTTSAPFRLNGTGAGIDFGPGAASATTFNVCNLQLAPSTLEYTADFNVNGATYVAYLFAHDTTSDGIIQCGSAAAGTDINLGWEPQFVIVKKYDGVQTWIMEDNMRGMAVSGNTGADLFPNTSDAESTGSNNIYISSTGFKINLTGNYIYIAIRRGPMRTPTSGTSVFSPVSQTPSGVTTITTGFPVDMTWFANSSKASFSFTGDVDRLRGTTQTSTRLLLTNGTDAEAAVNTYGFGYDRMTSITDNYSNSNWGATTPVIYWNFRRAPSFFDEVCYTGTGSARTVSHNLGVAPELMIVKNRSSAVEWRVYNSSVGAGAWLVLNTSDAPVSGNITWNTTAPTASVFTVGGSSTVNGSGSNYVAYLFASCPGVSKVGSYTGNGSSQTINCGFAAGARFVMIKRIDSTGDWYVWDSARGIVAGNDPRLSLNSTAAEVTTDDSVDTDSSGFVVNQLSATNINVSSATYIYLAVA